MKSKTKIKKTVKSKKVVKVKAEKPAKVKELFKYKKVAKSAKVNMGNHFYNETLATDEYGSPLVTQSVTMSGDKIVKTTIFDIKNNIIINKIHE